MLISHWLPTQVAPPPLVRRVATLDVATKFFNAIYLRGSFRDDASRLIDVEVDASEIKATVKRIGSESEPGLSRWELQILLAPEKFPENASVIFTTAAGDKISFAIGELLAERDNASCRLSTRFSEVLADPAMIRVLDLGGRDRSRGGVWRFSDRHDVTVFDIIDDPGVNVVGDAHDLSLYFPANHFDAVHCISVLEHIAMPWKVAIEVAKVLRPGGIGFFQTHQTVGMHDLPWDFWRISEFAWDALFNKRTGFSVEARAMAHECFIIPFRWRQGIEFEKAAGYESSTVIVKKIGEPTVEWPVALKEIVGTMYPA